MTAPRWPASSTSYAPASPGGCCQCASLAAAARSPGGGGCGTGRTPASGSSQRARQAGGCLTGPNPTDRGKPGSKDHLLVDGNGTPLAVCLSAANTHDSLLLEQVVDTVAPLKGPRDRRGRPRNRPVKLHLDKAYDDPRCRRALRRRGITRGSPGVASSPASGSAATGRWWSGHWPGWWAIGGCRCATSDGLTSCWVPLPCLCADLPQVVGHGRRPPLLSVAAWEERHPHQSPAAGQLPRAVP
jgi:Transposase DDE domain